MEPGAQGAAPVYVGAGAAASGENRSIRGRVGGTRGRRLEVRSRILPAAACRRRSRALSPLPDFDTLNATALRILEVRALRGPNYWSRRTVLESRVDLGPLVETASNEVPGFIDRLLAWLPSLVEHRCSVGERGGFIRRLRDGTYPAHILEHTSIELENLAGTPVGFGKARETPVPGVYKVAIRYREEAVARACLAAARELLIACYSGRDFDIASERRRLRELAEDAMLGPSTRAIVDAAEARGVPVRRLNAGSLVQLGQGARARRIWTAETDRTSAIAESIAQDKELTKTLLAAAGVPVPRGRIASDAEDAWAAACEIGLPVVVKPRDGNHGRGVATHLIHREEVETAFTRASEEGSGVIVERFAEGNEHRLLVVGGKLVAAARGESSHVTGDGKSTIEQLVETQLNTDPRRGDGDEFPLALVSIDTAVRLTLHRQGYTPASVPAAGEPVLISPNGNVAFDCTDLVHPAVAAKVELAARVVGLDIAGLDLVVQDISRPLEPQGGVVVEVNSSPGLSMHLKPASGRPRPVGEAIASVLFPEGETGRIPIVCVTGTNGKSTVAHLVERMLSRSGRTVGSATSEGLFVGGSALDCDKPEAPSSARRLFLNPCVEAAVVEAGAEGILQDGLAFDRCDVAVVTAIGEADHLVDGDIATPEKMADVKRCPVDVVLPTGTAILDASDPLVAAMAPLSAGAVMLYDISPENEAIRAHLAEGRRALFVRDDAIVVADGTRESVLARLAELPWTAEGRIAFQVRNALAAAAAGLALGLPLESVLGSLAQGPGLPGRFEVHEFILHPSSFILHPRVIIDRVRNASALRAVADAMAAAWPGPRSVVWSVPAGARPADAATHAEVLKNRFDRAFLVPDPATREEVLDRALDSLRAGESLLVRTDTSDLAATRGQVARRMSARG